MTFAEIQDDIHRRLREATSSGIYFSTQDIQDAANAGYMELSDATEWLENYTDVDLLKTRPYYDLFAILGPGFLSVKPAFDTNRHRWLLPSIVRLLDQNDPRWERVVGTPQRIFLRGLRWLGLYPRTDTDAVDSIRLYHTRLPDPMCEDDDEPGFPEAYHMGCVEFALADLYAQDGETAHALESWTEYLKYETGLQQWVNERVARPILRVMGAQVEPR